MTEHLCVAESLEERGVLLFVFCFGFFETGSHYISLAGLKLAIYTRQTLSSQRFAPLDHLSARIIDLPHAYFGMIFVCFCFSR